MGFIEGVIKSFIFGGIGMFIGGPIGLIIGCLIAVGSSSNSNGGSNYRHSFNCPHCNAKNGVDSYGRYNCYSCKEAVDISSSGVCIAGISVICPFCFEDNIIEYDGKWNCYSCSKTFTYRNNRVLREDESFLYLFMALLAKVAKTDGRVTNKKIEIVDDILVNLLDLDSESRKLAIEYFNKCKDSNNSFQKYCYDYKRNIEVDDAFDKPYDIFCDTLGYLYKIASSEGEISFKASEYLNCAVGVLGITANDFNSIKGEFGGEVEDKYYKILGCKKGDSKEQIKSQYRKLVKEYHPDKVNNMNVSDAVKETLIDKFKDVQEAYEKVK
ncbi:MAG: DnaJ domain-containing protein [Sarcina sp.]